MTYKKLSAIVPARPVWYDAARVRILLDYRPALRQRTGVGQYVHELASALQPLLDADDSLVLFSSSWKDRLHREAIPGASSVDARIPVRILNAAWHRFEWPPVEVMAGPVDIAHSLHPLLMPARGARQVVTIHDLDFLDHPERTRAEVRRDYPTLAAKHAARADLVVVNSHYTADLVRTRLGVPSERILVCRPGVPLGWLPRDVDRPAGPIVFIGTIEPRKNLPTLFAAYAKLVQARPTAPPLVLAGRLVETSAAILREIETQPGLAERIRHLGYVSDEARYALYRDASVVVVPSLEEGFGLTALEAMHVGVPVIASGRGALPEVVGDAAATLDPLDAPAWTATMADLLEDAQLRKNRIEAGRSRARTFTWRASARELLESYRRVVAPRTPSPTC